jgi:hypothetical protein
MKKLSILAIFLSQTKSITLKSNAILKFNFNSTQKSEEMSDNNEIDYYSDYSS